MADKIVNGVEVKVGQVWTANTGRRFEVTEIVDDLYGPNGYRGKELGGNGYEGRLSLGALDGQSYGWTLDGNAAANPPAAMPSLDILRHGVEFSKGVGRPRP